MAHLSGPLTGHDYLDAVLAGMGTVTILVLACMYIATELDVQDRLPAAYMLFVLVGAMGIFVPEDDTMRARRTAAVIIVVAGVSVTFFFEILGCVVAGRIHWIELIILIPPFLLAALLLRAACRHLKRRVDELQQKHYTLPKDEHRLVCPVCGFEDEPKARHELWEPFYDARYGVYRHGIAYNYTLKKYECGFARSGRCTDGPFEQPRDLAEHMLNEHWDDRFHCPGCLRSLRRVRCGGEGWGK